MVEYLQLQQPVSDVVKLFPERATDSGWKDVIKSCEICVFSMISTMNFWRQCRDYDSHRCQKRMCLVWDSYKIDFLTGSIVRIPCGDSLTRSLKLSIPVKCSQLRSLTQWWKHHNTRPSASISLVSASLSLIPVVMSADFYPLQIPMHRGNFGISASCLSCCIWVTSIALFVFHGDYWI